MASDVAHGTKGGFEAHVAAKKIPCLPCREAFAGRDPFPPERGYARCGTREAWRRHRRHGETPCDACQAAQDEGLAAWEEERNRRRSALTVADLIEAAEDMQDLALVTIRGALDSGNRTAYEDVARAFAVPPEQ